MITLLVVMASGYSLYWLWKNSKPIDSKEENSSKIEDAKIEPLNPPTVIPRAYHKKPYVDDFYYKKLPTRTYRRSEGSSDFFTGAVIGSVLGSQGHAAPSTPSTPSVSKDDFAGESGSSASAGASDSWSSGSDSSSGSFGDSGGGWDGLSKWHKYSKRIYLCHLFNLNISS